MTVVLLSRLRATSVCTRSRWKWVKKARESSGSTSAPLEDSERAELERLRAENTELIESPAVKAPDPVGRHPSIPRFPVPA